VTSMRVRLTVSQAEQWDQFRDATKPNEVLFCPLDDPSPTSTHLTVEVVFLSGPRFLLRGTVVWRRPASDRQIRAGVGLELEPRYLATLQFINAYCDGQTPDRRQFTRIPVRLRVTYHIGAQRRINFTRDVSPAGLYIHSSKMLAANDPIRLSLSTLKGDGSLELAGRVMYSDATQNPGMGLQLMFTDGSRRDAFASFIDELARMVESGQLPDDLYSLG